MKKYRLLFDLFVFAIVPSFVGIGCFMIKEKLGAYVGPVTGDLVEPLMLLRVGTFFMFVGVINFISLAARQQVFVKIFLIVGVSCIGFGMVGPFTKESILLPLGTLSIIIGAINSISLLGEEKNIKESVASPTNSSQA